MSWLGTFRAGASLRPPGFVTPPVDPPVIVPTGGALALLSANTWLDTVTSGGLLATILNYEVGDNYTARLLAQPARPQPATNALAVVNGEVRAGAGFSALRPEPYICELENTVTGAVTHVLVRVLSDKVTTYTATNPTELAAHLETIGDLISLQGVNFAGAVIDIAPGDYGAFTITQLPKNGQVQPVVLRSSATDRLNGAKPRFTQLWIEGGRFITLQSLAFEPYGNAFGTNPLSPMLRATTASGDFWCVMNCRAKGGDLEWNGAGLARVNPALNVNSANDFLPAYTYFRGQFSVQGSGSTSVGTFTRLDLYRGHLQTTETGAPLGVWKAATVPAYVGPNTPNGQAGIFDRTNWRTRIPIAGTNPQQLQTVPPADFDAEFEVRALTSTPIATTNGGMQAKPEGGPDGNYIVAWRLTNGGTWNGVGTQRSDSSIEWVNQATYWRLPAFIDSGSPFTTNQQILRNFILDRCDVRDVTDGFRDEIRNVNDSYWITDNTFDMLYRDVSQVFWESSTTAQFLRIWNPDNGFFFAFNRIGRPIGSPADIRNPHCDGEQHAQRNRGPTDVANFSHVQTYISRIGNVQSSRGGRAGTGVQGPFASDMFRARSGYRIVSAGNFIDSGVTIGWSAANNMIEQSAYDSVITTFGSGNQNFPSDPNWPTGINREFVTYGTRASISQLKASQSFLDDRASTGNDSTVWSAPQLTHTLDYPTLRSRFTAVGANEGYGAFAARGSTVDHEFRAWNPNLWRFRLLLPETGDHPVSTLVAGRPRQLLFGTKALPVSVTGGQWSKGATWDAALAATPTSAPGTISKGEWLVPWVQTSALMDATATVNVTVNGVVSPFTARTIANWPFPANGGTLPITTQTYVSPNTSTATWQVFNNLVVPNGTLALVMFANDGGATVTPSDPNAIATWAVADSDTLSQTCRGSMFWWFNNTGANQTIGLLATYGAAEMGSCVVALIPRQTPGNVLRVLANGVGRTSSTSSDLPNLPTGVTRNYMWVAGLATDGIASASASPAGYGAAVSQAHGSSAGASSALTWRFERDIEEDPGAWTLSTAQASVAITAAVYEGPA